VTTRLMAALAALLLCGAALAQSNSALRDPKQAAAFKRTHACPATGKVQRACPAMWSTTSCRSAPAAPTIRRT
jgi:hypothetical protein